VRRAIHIEGGNWDAEAQANFDQLQKERQLHFARFCWKRRHQLSPSGKTWGQVFESKEGLTLDQFKTNKEQENG
jgi:hypothetical protein